MWIPSWITLLWTPYTFIPPEITPLLTVQSIFKLNSGYLHIPIHAQGKPLAFRGLLLVKVFSFLIDAMFSDSLMTRTAIAPRVRPRKGAPHVAFQTLDLARSTSIHQLLPGTGLLVRRRHSVLSDFVSRCPYQKSNWRAHLLLVSRTPRLAGGGIGVITLEGTCRAPMASCIILSLDHGTR